MRFHVFKKLFSNYENDGNLLKIEDNYTQIPMIHNWTGQLVKIVDCLPKMCAYMETTANFVL